MKKVFTVFLKYVLILLPLLFVFSVSSCRKKTDNKAVVTVVDSTGHVVSGVSVKLYANVVPQGDIQDIETTDADGKAYFDFKLQAIFDILATKGSMQGTGIIKLEPGSTVQKTVIIQ